ncbi:SMI1/KNR4 family protein [Amycolatopsis taiwanensis]|uniref:SMI1/KNR4 family protein n=1 Tax=Amycolatopsis taiwanensis TaxID=342230 RepID=UPI0004BCCCC6|nr:SMI1/KNR4 family protein [Amycolatopsis taiwanensis]
MSSAADVDVLMRLMSPPRYGGTPVDWESMAWSWERPFPPDYQRFIEVYGAGTIQDFLSIVGPQPKDDAGWDGMVDETGNAEDMWEDTSFKSSELEGTSPYLITWGVSGDADLFCWDATGEDPASWPVLVYDNTDGTFSHYDCGMVEFLIRMLGGDFPRSPVKGEVVLWGKGEATGEKR